MYRQVGMWLRVGSEEGKDEGGREPWGWGYINTDHTLTQCTHTGIASNELERRISAERGAFILFYFILFFLFLAPRCVC